VSYRIFAIAVLSVVACACAPGVASAANYCVGTSAACTGSPVADFNADAAGITSAVTAANANAGTDNIFLAAGSYPLASSLVLTFAAAQDVHVIGAGAGQTVFTGSVASLAQVTFNFATTASDVQGVSLNVTGTPANATGLRVFNGTISDFAITQPGGQASNFRALVLDSGATATRGSIAITSGTGTGLYFSDQDPGADDGSGNASQLTLTGGVALSAGIRIDTGPSSSHVLDRLRISRFGRGMEVDDGGFQLTNTLIDMGNTNAAQGIDAFNGQNTSHIFANASRVTIVGTGPFQTAMDMGATALNTQSFTGGFSDLVLFAAGEDSTGLLCTGGGISVTATINSYAIRGAEVNTSGCSPSEFNRTDLAAVDPGFRDFSGGDYRLKPSSPLVDGGMVGETIISSERDLTGAIRVVDGDANGSVVVDLGAFEYQRTAPTVSASACGSAPRVGESCAFSATGADGDGDSLTFAWVFDDGVTATGASAAHAFLNAGPHTATVTATDASGLTASATAVVTVAALPAARVTAKPKKAFPQRKKGFAAPKKKSPFFTVVFADSAKAKFTLQLNRKGKLKSIKGSQTLSVKTGPNKFAFGGKFGGKKLKAGKYRAAITPIGRDGFAGKSVSVNFTLK
jgi:hypothetical protein